MTYIVVAATASYLQNRSTKKNIIKTIQPTGRKRWIDATLN